MRVCESEEVVSVETATTSWQTLN